MPNIPKYLKYAKICTIELRIFFTIIMKRIWTSFSMFFYVEKNTNKILMHELTSSDNVYIYKIILVKLKFST